MRAERSSAPAARGFSPAAWARSSVRASGAPGAPGPSRVLVIGCGALAHELVAVIDQAGLSNVDLTCLPATLHNRPGAIPAAVREKIRAARPRYERIFIAYADCGTGGLLDPVLADEGVERLPGAHCYEFYAGSAAFAATTEEDPATFFLTDFLARNFDRLVIVGLGLDRHPELLPTYFGNYHRLVYLAQTDDPELVAAARRAATRLGLTFEMRQTGYGELASGVIEAARQPLAAGAGVGLAAGASSATNRHDGALESGDSLRPGQETALRTSGDVRGLPPQQGSRREPAQSRRFLRPAQGTDGSLRGRQDLRRPTGVATSDAGSTVGTPTGAA
jgi:hypothetical protein